ncbi:uncharacterized protein EV422DRAFT_577802 [Fimicolochytrium jonesii]|uniref:uncharacterized protein n=1 Tax=Fimicolochytrium jonesii TaxID=1396493 RepID=UPI0022FE45D2|nr:uncharacterized protein EV422DRAFT_577802 [Fimicolochytrium jonesii]KAI8822084.1 hypothetical protein EV422DRAFT_577802 [Fimicolochytrium jonesii]
MGFPDADGMESVRLVGEPVRPTLGRRRTMVRTDSAPCDITDDNASLLTRLAAPPAADQVKRSKTPPHMPSHRPSLIATAENRILFFGTAATVEEGKEVQSPVDALLEGTRRSLTEVAEAANDDDEGSGRDDASSYSTASEDLEGARQDAVEQQGVPPATLQGESGLPGVGRVQPDASWSNQGVSLLPSTDSAPLASQKPHPLLLQQSMLSPGIASTMEQELSRLDIRRYLQWILCFALVNFDLELGQALECVYPHVGFSEAEKKNISFSAFPDSNSSAHLGDNTFSFRMRSESFTTNLYRRQSLSATSALNPVTPTSGGYVQHKVATTSTLAVGPNLPVDTDGFTYGYVFFRQQRDAQIRRGYFQVGEGSRDIKSLVVLSPHPWPGLFLNLVARLGPVYMDALIEDRTAGASSDLSAKYTASRAILETACYNVASWPAPPSSLDSETSYIPINLTLPFLGQALQFSFPPNPCFAQLFETQRTSLKPQDQSLSPPNSDVPIVCTPGRFYELFSGSLELLWISWELMVIGQSLLVIAESPGACSSIAWALVELIKPIPFGGDFRPYFTIQDSDFRSIVNRQRLPTIATVIGVTNPVFTKVLEHWPNVVRAAAHSHPPQGDAPHASKPYHIRKAGTSAGSPAPRGTLSSSMQRHPPPTFFSPMQKPSIFPFGNTGSPSPTHLEADSSQKRRERTISAACDGGQQMGAGAGATVESITCKHKPFLSKDRKLLKEVVEAAIRGKPVHLLNNMLRRHFIELTERFIQPLNRHFESLIVGNPLQMNLTNIRSRPEIRPFKQESFLRAIEQCAPNLPVTPKRPIADLYRSFLLSPNFAAWLQHRTSDVFRDWRRRYLEVLCNEDVETWARSKLQKAATRGGLSGRRGSGGDVECVDLLLRIRDEVVKYAPYFPEQDLEFGGSEGTGARRTKRLSPEASMPATTSTTSLPASNSIPSVSTKRRGPAHIDLSARSDGWASSICAAAPSPQSPGPVDVMGGVVPTPAQYTNLKKQMERLIGILPEELRGSIVGKGREARDSRDFVT